MVRGFGFTRVGYAARMDTPPPNAPVNAGGLGIAAGLMAGLAVAAGAFGAHGLRGRLDPSALATFETAARYHLVHSLAAAFAADRAGRQGGAVAARAAAVFLAGTVLFSGSLYVLALGGPRLAGAITPLGGLAFMAGWVLLALSFRAR
jgi:uncharacterized membrane protein YgdD (TMEM256/DUF423 family)